MGTINVSEIVTEINRLADENEPVADVVGWINDAIAKINIELDATFPYLDVSNLEDEPAFPEVWQRALLIPFGVGRVKQMDSSQFEYTDAYNEFAQYLTEMKSKYSVPDEFKDETRNRHYAEDFSKNMYNWTGGW